LSQAQVVERLAMSEMGHERLSGPLKTSSALLFRADLDGSSVKRRFVPEADIGAYSITSSARDRNEGEIESPMAFAVFKLMISSNLVGCCTGRSAGSMPRRILST
jgi:hypothetical protein